MPARTLGTADLALLESLFEHLPECPFFVKDRTLTYVAANSAMANLCGAPHSSELIGRSAAEFFPRSFAEHYERLDRSVLEGAGDIANRLELSRSLRARGTWLLFSRVAVRDERGRIVGVAATSRQLPSPDRYHPTYVRLSRVAKKMQQDIEAPLDLPGLAGLAEISPSQLERDFTRVFGTTLQAFQHRLRIEKAMKLLETDSNIAGIALQCGFSDHSAFTRRFRATVGVSPRAYRQQFTRGRNSP